MQSLMRSYAILQSVSLPFRRRVRRNAASLPSTRRDLGAMTRVKRARDIEPTRDDEGSDDHLENASDDETARDGDRAADGAPRADPEDVELARKRARAEEKRAYRNLERLEALIEERVKTLAEREAELVAVVNTTETHIAEKYAAHRARVERDVEITKGATQTQKKRVVLNVGGARFETSLDTLRNVPGSFLAAMFSGEYSMAPSDEDGSYFIDRDGTHFRHVLNFHRAFHEFALDPDLTRGQLAELAEEAKYYGILEQMMPAYAERRARVERGAGAGAGAGGKRRGAKGAKGARAHSRGAAATAIPGVSPDSSSDDDADAAAEDSDDARDGEVDLPPRELLTWKYVPCEPPFEPGELDARGRPLSKWHCQELPWRGGENDRGCASAILLPVFCIPFLKSTAT